jgi:hypothetical protein
LSTHMHLGKPKLRHCSVFHVKKKQEIRKTLKKNNTVNCFSTLLSTVGWNTALQAGRSRVRFPMVSSDFFIDIIFLAAVGP